MADPVLQIDPPPGPSISHDADLTKAMEHLRPYVSIAPTSRSIPHQAQPRPKNTSTNSSREGSERTQVEAPTVDPGDVYGVPFTALSPPRHVPDTPRPADNNPNGRADPFTFGSRLLTTDDDIFSFNAWDHVDPSADASYTTFQTAQYDMQRANPVAPSAALAYNAAPARFWDRFYRNNNANFFKDRKWLFHEFPTLREACAAGAGPRVVLEVGAGAGNTAFPLLRENANDQLMVHAVDYAASAVELMRGAEAFDARFMRADVWDVAGCGGGEGEGAAQGVSLPPGLGEGCVDVVVLIFVFSALAPGQWAQALRNIWALLKPGGEVLFRDYGRGDLAQVRFKKGRYLDENFYIRGDGTRVYFFERDELEDIFGGGGSEGKTDAGTKKEEDRDERDNETDDGDGPGPEASRLKFDIIDLGVDRRMLVNRQRRLKMYRCWMQGRFRKPT